MQYTIESLQEILKNHKLWLDTEGKEGQRAYLSWADLRWADLTEANLSGANLSRADLREANLSGVDLRGANLSRADLRGADLTGANLIGADLRDADLRDANLSRADLTDANLLNADMFMVNITDAKLPEFRQIPQNVELVVWKKIEKNTLVKLKIPAEAKRTTTPVSNKCRAEYAEVLEIIGEGSHSMYDGKFVYEVGKLAIPENGYHDDILSPCLPGIHFFMTKEEAEAYDDF